MVRVDLAAVAAAVFVVVVAAAVWGLWPAEAVVDLGGPHYC